jgi:hypothetical protein
MEWQKNGFKIPLKMQEPCCSSLKDDGQMPLRQIFGRMLFEWQIQFTITYHYEERRNQPSNYSAQHPYCLSPDIFIILVALFMSIKDHYNKGKRSENGMRELE